MSLVILQTPVIWCPGHWNATNICEIMSVQKVTQYKILEINASWIDEVQNLDYSNEHYFAYAILCASNSHRTENSEILLKPV